MKTKKSFVCTVALLVLATTGACHRGPKPQGGSTPAESTLPPVNSASGLIEAMRDRYSDKWYKSLSFTQVNTYTIGGKQQKSEWVENLSVPARLRVDFIPLSQKSGLLIDNYRVLTFVSGKRIDTRRQLLPRPFLVSDIYVLAPRVSVQRLDSLGVDTTRFRTDRMDGRRVFVIGAEPGDMAATQVWIDGSTLLLARFIQGETRAGKKISSDMRVTGYTEIAGFPIPEAFVTSREGVTSLREEFTNVKVNAPMPAALFDPAKWAAAKINQE